ncbi:LCP family protein [Clostridium sp.]|uniref:LCP family protein n=1 Tax=Clostridium sp. TaxID=1506 RepID=UPI003F31B040
MKRKLSIGKTIFLTFISLIILSIISASVYVGYLGNKVQRVSIDRKDVTDTELDPSNAETNFDKEQQDVFTIALFGTDYSGETIGAADSTLILSINKNTGKINLLSLMRDMYLDLPNGSGQQNLNYTMSSGGPSLILKTINYNFNLKIDKFIQVDLKKLPSIIDRLGGMEIEITPGELEHINRYIKSIDKRNETTTELLTSPGMQSLNGTQIAAYCRIRATDGGDFKRTERQRDVILNLFEKSKNLSILDINSIANDLLPYVSTNLTNEEIFSLNSILITARNYAIEQSRFPLDGEYETVWTDMYHMLIDKEQTTKEIHDFLYSN